MKVTTWEPFWQVPVGSQKKPGTWLDGVYRSRGTIPTMWPPTVISSFLNPIDYSHKLTREFHLVPHRWTIYKFVTIINNSYWNYVNQLSYRLGAPHCKNWAFRSSPDLESFRRGTVDIMIATDVASRGLDISRVLWRFTGLWRRGVNPMVHQKNQFKNAMWGPPVMLVGWNNPSNYSYKYDKP